MEVLIPEFWDPAAGAVFSGVRTARSGKQHRTVCAANCALTYAIVPGADCIRQSLCAIAGCMQNVSCLSTSRPLPGCCSTLPHVRLTAQNKPFSDVFRVWCAEEGDQQRFWKLTRKFAEELAERTDGAQICAVHSPFHAWLSGSGAEGLACS